MCILFSVGPCALEYTKLKTSDHFWTDPSANELVQRHRIHGAHRSQDTSAGRRPALGVSGLAVRRQSPAPLTGERWMEFIDHNLGIYFVTAGIKPVERTR